MGQRTEELRDVITRNYEDIRTLFGRMSEADMSKKTDTGWPVRALAGHIAESPGSDTYVAKRLSAGKNATLPGFLSFVIDLGNWWSIRKYGKATKADLLGAWENAQNQFFAYVTELTDEQLDRAGTVMGLGQRTAYEYLKGSPSHSQEHAESIRNVIDQVSTPM